ncbi:hypothetical protein [Deinococcus altitudinis]|uniref:hypothetical protein n=1 Tax=Deinococcus altitudinis TaxID=468914 RepID=UPI0038927B98
MKPLALLTLLSLGSAFAASCPPTFGSYPTAAWNPGTAPPILDTPDKRLFRTMVRMGARSGDPFGDRYRLATWGCGTACSQGVLVDTRTGQVTPAPDLILGHAVKAGSRLLVVSPLDPGETVAQRRQMAVNVLPTYYVFQDRHFVQICDH